MWWIILIIVGGVLLLGGIGFVIYRMKNKNSGNNYGSMDWDVVFILIKNKH